MPFTESRVRRTRFLPPVLPLLAFLLYALTTPGLTYGAAASVYASAAALVERGTPALDGALTASPQVAYLAGHFYALAPPGPALLAAPVYALGLVLAPLLGPPAPALLVALLGPLAGALAVAGLARLARLGAVSQHDTALLTAGGALLLWPLTTAPAGPLLAAALLVWTLPTVVRLWWSAEAAPAATAGTGQLPAPRGGLQFTAARRASGQRARHGRALAFGTGAGLGTLLLLDYRAALLGALLGLALLVRLRRQRHVLPVLLLAAAVPAFLALGYALLAFRGVWTAAVRLSLTAAWRELARGERDASLGVAIAFGLLALALLVAWQSSPVTWSPALPGRSLAYATVVAGLLVALGALPGTRAGVVLPLDWRAPAPWAALALVAGAFVALLARLDRGSVPMRRQLAIVLALALPVVLTGALVARGAGAALSPAGENYLAPFALLAGPAPRIVWTLSEQAVVEEGQTPRLRLAPGASATSPWVDVTPGTTYQAELRGSGEASATFAWYDAARQPLAQPGSLVNLARERAITFAAPSGAAGLRLQLVAGPHDATVTDARLTLATGVRVEPFPDYNRAALAFSFDWETAMGGLIHTRSGGSEGAGVGENVGGSGTFTTDGSPAVATAEERGLQMRAGARFLAREFARYDIRATFYVNGYNLLDGNPTCEKFLGDPIYRNVDRAHGWGSDYWQTHRWYGHDPCTTEERAPAWYFGAQTRELAGAGHEIASHTFGHLYVRGVKPAELEADLLLWQATARRLGVPAAPSFAFPWTSSNSIDKELSFLAVFARLGLTVLTRMYQPLAQPYELDRVRANPALAIFPDFYLPSKPAARDEALARIDETLARRGYHSLWTHPDEVVQQDGPQIWPRVIAYAADARSRGLWVAPVSEIAGYSLATREVAVTALPVAGGAYLTVENRSSRILNGLTLALPAPAARVTIDGQAWTDVRAAQIRLPALAPGARVTIVTQR